MKGWVFLILFAACFFAHEPAPPISNITIENIAAAEILNSSFNESSAKTTQITILGQTLQAKGNMAIAGLSPIVDNTTNGTLMVIIQKGSNMDDFVSGDVDGDGCVESQKQKNAYYNITVEFRLAEILETVNSTSNIINATPVIMEIARNSSGNEILDVALNGSISFVYTIDDKEKIFSGECVSNEKIYEKTIWFNDSRNVFVAGENKIFFLTKPVLSEHWYRDNDINWFILSQSKIYEIEITVENKSGETEKKIIHLYDFNITRNEWGIAEIISIEKDVAVFAGRASVMPNAISEKNTTFSYVYTPNYTDSLELGEKKFTLRTMDVFSREERKEYIIYSRQLSLGEKTETGGPNTWETTRKSAVAGQLERREMWLFFGALGVLVVLMVSRFRLK